MLADIARSSAEPLASRRLMLAAPLLFAISSPARAQTAPTPPPPATAPEEPPGEFGLPREMISRTVLRVRQQSVWDQGFAAIRTAIQLLRDDAKRLGIATEEPPSTHFIDSDELGFTFEAMLPLIAPATGTPALTRGVDIGPSPAGNALVFGHDGTYDELDSAYEAITAWLDEKGHQTTGRFIEEYFTIPEKSDEPGLKMNIIVFLK